MITYISGGQGVTTESPIDLVTTVAFLSHGQHASDASSMDERSMMCL